MVGLRQPFIRYYRGSDATSLANVVGQAGFFAPQTAVSLHHHFTTIQNDGGQVWVAEQHGKPIGCAYIAPVPGLPHLWALDGFVTPSRQRQGVGSALLAAALAELSGSECTLSHAVASLDEPAACFLQQHQFALEHEEWQMVCHSGDGEETAVLPPSPHLTIRTLPRHAAIQQFIALYDRSFGPHPWYQPFTPQEVLATLKQATDLRFLYDQDTPIGFAWLQGHGNEAEIEPIGIVPEACGVGNGRFLLHTLLTELKQTPITHVCLGVWRQNQPAIQLYHSLGFRHTNSRFYLARSFFT